jgi:hypothetical protein
LCDDRVAYEKVIIDNLLESLELQYISSEWDGFTLKVNYDFDHSTECTRNDMLEYLPEIDYSNGDDLGSIEEEDYSYLLTDNSDLGKSQRISERDYSDYDGYSEDLWD